MAAVIPDPQLRAALEQQLQAILASPDFAGAERFPVVPLRGLSQLRPLLGTIDAEAPRADAVTTGELVTLLGACDAERGRPAPVGQVPGVGNGHFPNLALTRCQAAHSARLAQILTSLAADNGSEVRYQGKTLTSPCQLLAALVAAGHDIEVRNERTYANFISLTAGEVNVRWPVWLDTGIALAGGAHLTVPMGHSHHAWRISGPLVNARVMFYLGISGAAFFAQTGVRPAWTGDVVQGADSTADGADGATEHVLAAAAAAAAYLRRNRVERATVAQGMPADGYGFVGVCNDSNAAIEWATLGTISTFPLMRAAQLDQAALLGDGLDEAVRRLPHDADQAPARADGLRRVLAMTPHALGDAAAFAWDAALRAELQAAEAELAGR